MNVPHHKTTILLISITIVSFLIRVLYIDSIPKGLQNDEADFLYNALAIKKTLRDEDGRKLPVYLHSFIDTKPALYTYVQIPFLFVLSNTITAGRMPAVIFGTSSILLFFFLVREITLDKRFALLATFLLSISPWHLVNSRGTQEVIMSFTFLLAAILSLVLFYTRSKASVNRKRWLLFAYIICSLIAMYSYHSAKIFLPIITVITTLMFSYKGKKQWISGIFFFTFSLFLSTILTLTTDQSRMSAVGIFSDKKPQLILEEQIRTGTPILPTTTLRFFHNKIVNYSLSIFEKYSEHFTIKTLFLKGGEPKRYAISAHGLMYLIDLPLILLGCFYALYKKNKSPGIFMMSWFFIAPLAPALTWQEIPSTVRAFPMVIPLIYFSTQGIVFLWDQKKKIFQVLGQICILGGFSWGILYFINQYLVQTPLLHPWYRNTADQQMTVKLHAIQTAYSKIYITKSVSGQPYIYLALENLIPLEEFQNSPKKRLQSPSQFGKYVFTNEECPVQKEAQNLFVINHTCQVPPWFVVIDSARYDDGLAAYDFVIYERTLDIKKEDKN